MKSYPSSKLLNFDENLIPTLSVGVELQVVVNAYANTFRK